MKVAALDLGTNSFLCLVAEIKDGKIQKILSDSVEIVRLGQGVAQTQMFHPEALQRAKACLTRFKETIDLHQPERILAMATSAAREVKNSDLLFQIGRDLQIPIEIIPGEKEAEITYQGAISGFANQGQIQVVTDIGGGSTEMIVGKEGQILFAGSINVGVVRLTERFFPIQPPSSKQIEDFQSHLQAQLEPVILEIKKLKPQNLIAVAGTPTELAAAILGKYDSKKIDGMKISLSELGEWRRKFEQTSTTEKIEKLHISKGRADVILAGSLIQEKLLQMLEMKEMKVSIRGVRFGVALDLAKRG